VCGEAYPCRARRTQLLADFADAPMQFYMFVSADFTRAVGDLPGVSHRELYARFFGWYDAMYDAMEDTSAPRLSSAARSEFRTIAALAVTVMEAADPGRHPGTSTRSRCLRATSDPGLRAAWDEASHAGRRDVLTGVAELAARRGVDPAGLQPPAGAQLGHDLDLGAQYAMGLLELAAGELAAPGRDPRRSLLPTAPWEPATGPTGSYAMSWVCDFNELESAKLAAAVVLAAAAQQAAAETGPDKERL
jgi:hypothetical protein